MNSDSENRPMLISWVFSDKMLPHSNQDNAIIAAAKLAFDHAWRSVFDTSATSRSISAAFVPLFGIIWIGKIIVAFGQRPISRKVNQLLARVRNSTLSGQIMAAWAISSNWPTAHRPNSSRNGRDGAR